MDRRDAYTGQLVTEQHVDQWFDDAERADRNIISDQGLFGVFDGLEVQEIPDTPNLTVNIWPGGAYSPSGERMRSAGVQVVDCSVDRDGVSTAVTEPDYFRILTIIMIPERSLTDLTTDSTNQPVYYSRLESFRFEVLQGEEGSGPDSPVAPANSIILADIVLTYDQSSITGDYIDYGRRQDLFVAEADAYMLRARNMREALEQILTLMSSMSANNIDFTSSALWANGAALPNGTLSSAVNYIVYQLGGTFGDGGQYIGMAQDTSSPTTLPGATLTNRLKAQRLATNLYYAGSPAFADATTLAAGALESAIDAFVTALAGTAGAAKIGAAAVNGLTAGTVRSQLDQLQTQKASLTGAAFTGPVSVGNTNSLTVHPQLLLFNPAITNTWVTIKSVMVSTTPSVRADADSILVDANSDGAGTGGSSQCTQSIDLRVGTVINGLQIFVIRTAFGAPVIAKIAWVLRRRLLSTGVISEVAAHTDTVSGVAYGNYHAVSLTFPDHTIEEGFNYTLTVLGELGPGAADMWWRGTQVRVSISKALFT